MKLFKTQNAHSGRNVMPRCLSEGVDIFLKSAERQGESGHDVRVSRLTPWMASVGGPVMMRTALSLFVRKFTPGDATSRHDVPFTAGARGFFINFQFSTLPQYQSLPALQRLCLRSRVFCGGMPASSHIRRSRRHPRCCPG